MPGLPGLPGIQLKRVYDPPAPEDGRRILIDRLWPRGVSKVKAKIDFWAKECAPSTELRQWYQHDAEKWPEFKQRYFAELDATAVALATLRREIGSGPVTFVFSSRETKLNNAAALVEYLDERGDPAAAPGP